MGQLDGKWAIVTGGNTGIGKCVVSELVALGARVIIATFELQSGTEAASEVRKQHPGARVECIYLDLLSSDGIRQATPVSSTKIHVLGEKDLSMLRKFASDYKASKRPLHILIANAGILLAPQNRNKKIQEGVPIQCQVNYLGHYMLVRLLEPVLISSAPSRIISVSSASHRFGAIADPRDFLSKPEDCCYADTKLAQVLFTYEAQRRLGHLGVDASAVDPGGVRSGVWRGSFLNEHPLFSWYIKKVLSPPSQGAVPILHAACVDYDKELWELKHTPECEQYPNLRFYAKGAFKEPYLTWLPGPTKTDAALDFIKDKAVKLAIFLASTCDWPIEYLSQGNWFSRPTRAYSVSLSYDLRLAKELWEYSARIAKVPTDGRD